MHLLTISAGATSAGTPEIKTPTSQARPRRLRLERHYVNPTCSPTRAGILTGRNPSDSAFLRSYRQSREQSFAGRHVDAFSPACNGLATTRA